MCSILSIKRSSYYNWIKRPLSKRIKTDNELLYKIEKIHKESYNSYGQRRIKLQLNKDGITCSRRRVKRIMDENGIHSKHKVKFKATTNSNHDYPIAPNLLNQDFSSKSPNEKWVGDLTYIATDEGWLYLASIQDLFTRKVCGWSFGERITKELTISAFKQAYKKEKPSDGLIFHSDRGSQYAAYAYQDLLKSNNTRQSMSRKGNCYDNACAESFFATLKKDIIQGERFRTREEAKSRIIEYIELFYNCKRIHSSINDMSPIEFERNYYLKESA
jgi:putative transposase